MKARGAFEKALFVFRVVGLCIKPQEPVWLRVRLAQCVRGKRVTKTGFSLGPRLDGEKKEKIF